MSLTIGVSGLPVPAATVSCTICAEELPVDHLGIRCWGTVRHEFCDECSTSFVGSTLNSCSPEDQPFPPKCSMCPAKVFMPSFERFVDEKLRSVFVEWTLRQASDDGRGSLLNAEEKILKCPDCSYLETTSAVAEQRERTRTGAKHLRIFSLASKAVGPPGGVSTVPARLQAINGPDAPLPQRLLSGPDSIAQMLLSGPEVGPSFSSSAQSPMSEAKECTLLLCRNKNVGGETGFGSTLRRASAGRRDGLGLNAIPSRAQGWCTAEGWVLHPVAGGLMR